MNLDYEVREIINQGYRQIDARSKLCQDIVLKAIADSGMADHATIKGGVVMRNLSFLSHLPEKNRSRDSHDLEL